MRRAPYVVASGTLPEPSRSFFKFGWWFAQLCFAVLNGGHLFLFSPVVHSAIVDHCCSGVLVYFSLVPQLSQQWGLCGGVVLFHHVFTRHMGIAANAAKLTVNVSILTATGEIIPVEVGVSSPVQVQHLSRYVHRTCNLLRAHFNLTCFFYTSCLNWFDAHFTTI